MSKGHDWRRHDLPSLQSPSASTSYSDFMRVGAGGPDRQLSKTPYPNYSAGLGGADPSWRHGSPLQRMLVESQFRIPSLVIERRGFCGLQAPSQVALEDWFRPRPPDASAKWSPTPRFFFPAETLPRPHRTLPPLASPSRLSPLPITALSTPPGHRGSAAGWTQVVFS